MHFAKRLNSTKRPSLATIEYRELNGKLRENTSVMSPTVSFNLGNEETPTWNYAYIEPFERLYFINDWTYEGGLWVAYMNEDVLATYKENINRSTQYVLRSSSSYDGTIEDSFYPTTTHSNDYRVPLRDIYNVTGHADEPNFFSERSLESGYFVVGVVGGNTTGITHYVMDYNNFKTFIQAVFNFTPSGFGDIGTGLAKQLANPVQYINSVMWFPVSPALATYTTHTIFFGYYSVQVTAAIFGSAVPSVQHYRGYFTIKPHPQSATRGKYMNTKMKRTIIMNPWGSFPVDPYSLTTMLDTEDTEITAEWYLDYLTGKAWLYITGGEGTLITTSVCVLGVPIPVAGSSTDIIGTIFGTGASIVGAAGSALVGNMAGAIAGTVSAISSAVQGVQPSTEKQGSQGSMISFESKTPRMFTYYMYDADDNLEKFGRPLCQSVKLEDLSGYCLCKDSKFYNDTSVLSDEVSSIESFLNTGVYLE